MITTSENSLFEEWNRFVSHDATAPFVRDGIVNEDSWMAAHTRVLYLLKEANGGDSSWDERDYLKNYNTNAKYQATHSQTISNLIRWQYGLVQPDTQNWQSVQSAIINTETQSKLLSEICLVNLKKTAGGGIVNWKVFDAYWEYEKNREYIKRQLNLYLEDEHYYANIMVCGGTAYFLSQLYGLQDSDWRETQRGIRYTLLYHTVCIDFCHPNNRGPKNIVFYGLVDALDELKKQKRGG